MGQRTYTDEEAAHALAVMKANHGNAKKTARDLNVPRTTLRQWAGRAHTSTGTPKQVSESAVTEAERILGEMWRQTDLELGDAVLTLLEDARNEDGSWDRVKLAGLLKDSGSLKNLLIGRAVATDKGQLLTGGPTSRDVQVKVSYLVPTALRDLSSNLIEGTFTPIDVPQTAQLPASTQDEPIS